MTRYIITGSVFIILLCGFQAGAEPSQVFDAKQIQADVIKEFQRHNYKKVIQIYKNFIDKSFESPSLVTKTLYSESLASSGEIEEAIEVIQEIIVDLPDHVDPVILQYNLANLLFIEKRYSEATQAYRKILRQTSQYQEISSKARERLALLNNKEGKKKDVLSLELLDLETTLEAGEIPDGAESLLQKAASVKGNPAQVERAKKLLLRIREIRIIRAQNLLEEARRLFDEEKRYEEVRDILDRIHSDYSDVCDQKSVEVLSKEVDLRLGKAR